MRTIIRLSVVGAVLLAASSVTAAVRVSDWVAAQDAARDGGRDIFVYQYGSDWNGAGVHLKESAWDTPAFATAMGTGSVLLAVDMPDGPPPSAASASDAWAAAMSNRPPLLDIKAVATDRGTKLERQTDGSWKVQGAAQYNDVYTVDTTAGSAVSVLFVEAMADDTLPCKGPGLGGNGNFALNEAEVLLPGEGTNWTKVALTAAWANRWSQSPVLAIDGTNLPADKVWDPKGYEVHEDALLALVPEKPLPAGAAMRVKLYFVSPWGQHLIGRLRLRASGDPELATAVRTLSAGEQLRLRNAAFDIRSGNLPAVTIYDASGRVVKVVEPLRPGRTPAEVAKDLLAWQAKRIERDRLWAQAAKAEGGAKAELLGKGLDLMECNPFWFGHKNLYRPVFEELKKADPQDASHYVRKYSFNAGEYQGQAMKLAGEKKYEEALALLDAQMANPTNSLLSTEQLQQLQLAKFHVYRSWPDHQQERFGPIRKMAEIDPETVMGKGARGYLMMNFMGPVTITYGWNTNHVRGGSNAWDIDTDAAFIFDHAGPYALTLERSGGRDGLDLRGVSLLVDGVSVSADTRAQRIDEKKGTAVYNLQMPERRPAQKLALRIEYTAAGNDSRGNIRVEPQLPPTPP